MEKKPAISKPYTLTGEPTLVMVEKIDSMLAQLFRLAQKQTSVTQADILKRSSFRG